MIRRLLAALLLAPAALVTSTVQAAEPPAGSPLDFTLTANDGKPYPLAQHRGQVVLLVNVASKCGFTKQYAGLQKLYESRKDRGLVVIGVPANDFLGQEPGTDEQIKAFCTGTYGVTFPLMAKVHVKGDGIDPLYRWLTAEGTPYGGSIGWNFTKFVIGRDGRVAGRFASKVAPDAPELVSLVDTALAEPVPATATAGAAK